jgi:thioredoxin-like negative regulator of GroEL
MSPQLAGLARQDGDKVVVLQVNVDRQPALAQRAGVRSIPDTRLYFAGTQVERKVGGMHLSQLSQMVQRHASKLPSPPAATNDSVATTDAPKKVSAKDAAAGPAIVPMDESWLPPGVTRE